MGSCLSKLCSGCTESKKEETTPTGLEVDEKDRDFNEIARPKSVCLDENLVGDVIKITNDTDQSSGLCAISGETEIPVQDQHRQLTEHDVQENKPSDFKAERLDQKHIEPRNTDDNGPSVPSSFVANRETNSDITSIPSHLNDKKAKPKENENFRHQNEYGMKDKNRSPRINLQGDDDSSNRRVKDVDRSKETKQMNSDDDSRGSEVIGKSPAGQRRVQSDTDYSNLSDTKNSSSSESEEIKRENKRRKKKSPMTKNYKAENIQFGTNNTIIVNKNIYHYHHEEKKTSKSKPKNTFTTKEPKTHETKHNVGLKKNTSAIKDQEIIVNAAKSVGIIRGPGEISGTGFRVGDNFVMTALHVVESFLDRKGYLQDSGLGQFSIQFDYKEAHMLHIQNKTFLFEKKVVYKNRDIDTVVLQVKTDANKILPDALQVFGEVSDNLCLIGHPEKDILQNNTSFCLQNEDWIKKAKNWSIENFGKDGYEGIGKESRVLFQTSFAHGASGSPVMHINNVLETSVVTAMLLRGYPEFYYTGELNHSKLDLITNSYKIEEGIRMKHIWQAMKADGYDDLSFQIFGSDCDGRN